MNKDFVIKDNVLIKYKGIDKIVKIPEGIKIIDSECFVGNTILEEVNCSKSLKTIKNDAFSNCINLKKINLDEVENISSFAFNNCKKIDEINIKNAKYIETNAFYNCNLYKVSFPKNPNNIDSNFLDFSKIKEIVINSETSVITKWLSVKNEVNKVIINNDEHNIYMYLFLSLNKLKEIEINNLNYKIKDGMIYSANEKKVIWCPPMLDIEKYKIPDTVEEISEFAFTYNKTIKAIELGKKVKKISKYAFSQSKIENIKFNNQLEIIEFDALNGTMCKEIDLSKTNIKILNLQNLGIQTKDTFTKKIIIPNKIEMLYKNNEKINICANLFKKDYPIEIQKIEEIKFKKTLEELIEEGKSFYEASQIMKNCER